MECIGVTVREFLKEPLYVPTQPAEVQVFIVVALSHPRTSRKLCSARRSQVGTGAFPRGLLLIDKVVGWKATSSHSQFDESVMVCGTVDMNNKVTHADSNSCFRYAIGVVRDKALHITPVTSVLALHPSFNYLDLVDKRGKQEHGDQGPDSDEEDKTKKVTVCFEKPETEKSRSAKEKSYGFLQKQIQEEPWIQVNYHKNDSERCEFESRKLYCRFEDEHIDQFTVTSEEYLRMLIPPPTQVEAVPPGLPAQLLSRSALAHLPLHDRVRTIMNNAGVASFRELLGVVDCADESAVLKEKVLQQVAVLVLGNWVVKSGILHPKDGKSESGVPNELIQRGRDYVLYQFSQSPTLMRSEIAEVVGLPASDVKDILCGVSKCRGRGVWEFLLPVDSVFLKKQDDRPSKYRSNELSGFFKVKVSHHVLNSELLKLAVYKVWPWAIEENGQPKGITVDILAEAARRLGVCLKAVRPPDNTWGLPLANGSWTGMIGMLLRKEAEATYMGLGINAQRHAVADFSEIIFVNEQHIIYRLPQLGPDLTGFVRPFTLQVWLCIVAVTLLAILALGITVGPDLGLRVKAAPGPTGKDRRGGDRRSSSATPEGTYSAPMACHDGELMGWWVFAVLLTQSVKWQNVGGIATMLAGGMWIMACFVITTVYKSNLKAMLISPAVDIPFNSFLELVDRNSFPWRIAPNTVIHQTLRDAPSGTLFHKGWGRISGFVDVTNRLGLIEDVAVGRYAMIVDTTLAKSTMQRDFYRTGQCRMTIARESVLKHFLIAIAFRKGSPLFQETNTVIRRFREFGILEKLMRDALPKAQLCFKPPDPRPIVEERTLVLEDLNGAFLLWGSGLLLSGIVLLFEYCCARNRRQNAENWPDAKDMNIQNEDI
ncbi:RNA polymerase III subunit E [Oratosquilla oratoria]|uniref:RNA polymerase III subunit E n=1 Tax=Oratosquilla oratoria TaxID=337810 RepID=UPI003F7693DE